MVCADSVVIHYTNDIWLNDNGTSQLRVGVMLSTLTQTELKLLSCCEDKKSIKGYKLKGTVHRMIQMRTQCAGAYTDHTILAYTPFH